MTLNINEILECFSGKLLVSGTYKIFDKISIDTRNIKNEDIFLAISGENFDGNKYIFDAIKKGVKLCIIDKNYFKEEEFSDYNVSVILVENTIDALRQIAILVRKKLDIDIIAVTGSVGKTTTKDLIYDFLSSHYRVYKNYGNFNNHIGMPISLINIDNNAEIGIFEIGMSNFGEINYLVDILRPNIGVITNIGVSHIEFLKTRENIFNAKMEIVNYFGEKDVLIVNCDDDLLCSVEENKFKVYKVGLSNCSDIKVSNLELSLDSIKFDIVYNSQKEEIILPIIGKHNVLNSIIAFKICELFKIPMDVIRKSFDCLTPSNMRQEIIEHNDMILINDCYNASPISMKSSIDVLSMYDKKKVCIFGYMAELGNETENYHREVSLYSNGKIDVLIAIGKCREAYYEEFNNKDNCFTFADIQEFERDIKNILNGNEAVLIKASRSSRFENVVEIIKNKF